MAGQLIAPFPGQYDRYITGQKAWYKVGFIPDVPAQSAEVNEVQSIIQDQAMRGWDSIFANGSYQYGGVITTALADSQLQALITAGRCYANGLWMNVPAGTVDITGQGTEVISLILDPIDIDETVDPDLLDPADNTEAEGDAGAHRLGMDYSFGLNTANGIPIGTLQDGQLVKGTQNTNSFLAQILQILATRTNEQSGSFVTTRPFPQFKDNADISTNPAQFSLIFDACTIYPSGVRIANTATVNLPIIRPLTGQSVAAEPIVYTTGVGIYTLDNSPILSVTSVLAILSSGTISMGRGPTPNGTDGIPSPDTPLATIVSVNQGGTIYTQNVDYVKSGNGIKWLGGVGTSQPATGSSYTCVVTYTKILTRAVRTFTSVSAESHTLTGASTTTLTNSDLSSITALTVGGTAKVLGTDYTYVRSTGVITWLGSAPSGAMLITYSYWAHTVEGDFVSRDSYQDANGNNLYNLAPTTSPNNQAIDYTTQIAFETSSGITPVTTTSVFITYSYTLGRVDVLVCDVNGIFDIIQGVPSTSPAAINPAPNQCPIAKLHLAPEATATNGGVTIEWYDNLTMEVVEQRQLAQRVTNIEFDLAQFQLASAAQNLATNSGSSSVTDKIGIFADPLTDPTLADNANVLFAGSFDLINGRFALPRNGGIYSAAPIGSSNAVLQEDTWSVAFTEQLALSQPFKTATAVINQYGGVNTGAQIVLTPSADINTSNTLNIYSRNNYYYTASYATVFNSGLMLNIASASSAASGTSDSTSLVNSVLNKIPIDAVTYNDGATFPYGINFYMSLIPGYTGQEGSGVPSNATTVVSDSWATVQSTVAVSTSAPVTARVITIAGSNWKSTDKCITLCLDSTPLALTATGGTVQETTTGYTGGVRAKSDGTWSATFTVPAGTSSGIHTISVYAIDTVANAITSLASTTYSCSYTFASVTYYVTLALPPAQLPTYYVPTYNFSETTGMGAPTGDMLNATFGPCAYVIAYAVAFFASQGVTLSRDLLATAISVAFQTTVVGHNPGAETTIPVAIAAVVNLSSTNVSANALAMIAAHPYASLAWGSIAERLLDPLAQTFTPPADMELSSINLAFSQAGTSPVTVAIATVQDGIPTQNYLCTTTLPSASISTTGFTKFTFPKLVFLSGGVQYAFVVLTQDLVASIWISIQGQKDTTYGLVTQNPQIGSMLQSGDGASWSPLPGQAITFQMNQALFNKGIGYVNYGAITLAQASSMISFWSPYAEPSANCLATYQFSTDGSAWQDFPPVAEINLGQLESTIWFRVVLQADVYVSPTVINAAVFTALVYQSTGAYINRIFTMNSTQTYRYVDVYIDTYIPGGSTLVVKTQKGDGTFHTMTEQTADALVIDDTTTQRHYTFDYGSYGPSECQLLAQMTSSVAYSSPTLSKIRVICT